MESKLKLHEAIRIVLEEAKLPLTTRQIADEINNRSLYSRKDGRPIPTSQIGARVKNYSSDFEKIDGRIVLLEQRQRGLTPSDFEKVESEVWRVLDTVRGSIGKRQYYVLLFLLSLSQDDNFRVTEGVESLKSQLLDFVQESTFFSSISDVFSDLMERLSENDCEVLWFELNKIDSEAINHFFSELFDSLLKRMELSSGRVSLTNSTPEELSELFIYLAGNAKGKSVYNPFAGTLSLISNIESDQVIAQEFNPTTWAIGQLRLKANDNQGKVDFTCQDSIHNWKGENKYDLVLSIPPFGSRIENIADHKTVETFLLEKGVETLSIEGKLIVVLPSGFLFSGGRKHMALKEQLLAEDLLESVVLLPKNLFPNTGISSVCLVVNKSKQKNGKVRMFDASSFFTKLNRSQVSLNVEILKAHIEDDQESEFSRDVPHKEIQAQDYNLDVSRYLMPIYDGVKLSDVLTPLNHAKAESGRGKFVNIGTLKDESLSNELKIDEIGDFELKGGENSVQESCVLIALRGAKLKATSFIYEGIPIHISNDVFALKVDESYVHIDYLIKELNSSDQVLDQINSFNTLQFAAPRISKTDFLTIRVLFPPIKEQKEQVEREKEVQRKIEDLLSSEDEERKEELEKKSFDEFASLKHSTGTPRQNILSNSKTLIRFFKNEESGAYKELNEKFNRRYDIDLLKMITLIKSDIDHISKMFDVGERGLILSDFEKEDISVERVGKYIKDLSDHTYKFDIVKSFIDLTMGSPDTEDGEKDWEENYFLSDAFYKDSESSILTKSDTKISGNWTLFKILIENILSNANKHGFENEQDGNQLRIEITLAIYGLSIKIQNNGKPFPRGFDKQKFIAKFSTANKEFGTGLGGYDINRIADYFGNQDWKLELEDQNDFPVSFEFNFNTDTL